MTTELAHYDAMRRELALAHEIDEVKAIHDKAIAFEMYCRQAKDFQNEIRACEIRLRAERKCGERLREQERSKGGPVSQKIDAPPKGSSRYKETKDAAGITDKQAERWQKLADVPEDQFEATFAKPAETRREIPSTNGIIRANGKPKEKPVDDGALWLWGRLLDFERQGLLDRDPNEVCQTMLPHMRETVLEMAPRVAAWLQRITDVQENS